MDTAERFHPAQRWSSGLPGGRSVPLDPAQRSMILVDRQTGIEAEPVIVDRVTG